MVVVEILTKRCEKYFVALFAILLNICINAQKQAELIYILQWTYTVNETWIYRDLEMGQGAFISRNCSFQNCFITADRSYLESVLDFDVLLFNTVHLRVGDYNYDLPLNRSEVQLYVMVCVEPAWFNPIPALFNGFFNLTWTYKLASDIVHPYFVVKNNLGNIIGPKIKKMQWMNINEMAPTNSSIVQKLRRKRIAAMWVASNWWSRNRLLFVSNLTNELSKYGHRIDIYGTCGNLSCPRNETDRKGTLTNCYSKIESDYYFYLAFENSNTEDYVSEKVLHGLQHFSVPVVFGGADYSRFLPDGVYLDALKLGEEKLAKEMNDIINDPTRYYDFFKWHGHYSFHDTADDNYTLSVCAFCAFLNNKARRYKTTTYMNIKHWWKEVIDDDDNKNNNYKDINEALQQIRKG